jgi:hypothetical protein
MLGFGIMDEVNVQQYQQMLRRAPGGNPPPAAPPTLPPGLEDFNNGASKPYAPSPNSIPTPFGLKKAVEPKPKVAPKQAVEPRQNTVSQGNTVELTGLPKTLMSPAMIETLVDQAVCTQDVHINEITFAQGKAYVSFANPDDAAAFIMHCHGRPWNPKGPPVSAVLFTPPMKGAKKTKPQKAVPKPNSGGVSSISNRMKMPAPHEQQWGYVNKAVANQMQYRPFHATNSETSTAAGDSDGEERIGFPLQFGASLQL